MRGKRGNTKLVGLTKEKEMDRIEFERNWAPCYVDRLEAWMLFQLEKRWMSPARV